MAKHVPKQKPIQKVIESQGVRLWTELRQLIASYAEAAIAESWKGGGDPEEIPILEMELAIAKQKIENHLKRMEDWFT